MNIFTIQDKLDYWSISTEFLCLLSSIVIMVFLWKLFRAFGTEKYWLFAVTGLTLCIFGLLLDLTGEIINITQLISNISIKVIIVLGMLLLSIGAVYIVRQLISLAVIDQLTGLYNKSYLLKTMDKEIERSRRYGLSFSILFLDIDDFKEINYRMGNLIGNVILRNISGLLRQKVRNTDVLGRYGGDEFLLLMPQTDINGANELFCRIIEKVTVVDYPGGNKIGIKGGIASFPADGNNSKQLINSAQSRMDIY